MNQVLPSGLSVPFASLVSIALGNKGTPEEEFALFLSYIDDVVTNSDRAVLVTRFKTIKGLSASKQKEFKEQIQKLKSRDIPKTHHPGYE